MRRTLIPVQAILLLSVVLCSAQSVRAQRSGRSGVVVIRGAKVWTGADVGTIDNGLVVLRRGKIADVESTDRGAPPAMPGITVIDASGKFVTPGLIDAWTMLAVDPGGPVGAAATSNVADALDVFERDVFGDARRSGVTGVCIEPPAPSGIVGTAAFVRLADLSDLHATTTESISLVARLGLGVRGPINRLGEIKELHGAFEQAAAYREAWDEYHEKLEEYEKKLKDGETVKLKKDEVKKDAKPEAKRQPPQRGRRGGRRGPRPRPRNFESMTDAQLLAWLQDTHVPGEDDVLEKEAHSEDDTPLAPEGDKSKDDGKKKGDGKKDKKDDGELTKPERPGFNADYEVIVRALKRELPVRFEAHRPGDIVFALKIINEFHLDATIVGASGAYLAEGRIADAEIPVVFGQLTAAGGYDRSHAADFKASAPAALAASGVQPVVIASGRKGGNSGAQYLTQNAAIAVAHGLDEDAALRAITIDAAGVCGVADEVGSIEKGKQADIVIWSGHPLAPDSVVERVFVGGKEVYRRAEK